MFQINSDGFVVDGQGFPANKQEILDLTAACAKTGALGEIGRVAMAKSICEQRHPGMVDQIDFTVFA